jgi:hypothetical protein
MAKRRGPKGYDDRAALRVMAELVARGATPHRAAWVVVRKYAVPGASPESAVDRLRTKFRQRRAELIRPMRAPAHSFLPIHELLAAAEGPTMAAMRQALEASPSEAIRQALALSPHTQAALAASPVHVALAALSPHERIISNLLPDYFQLLDEIPPTLAGNISKKRDK